MFLNFKYTHTYLLNYFLCRRISNVLHKDDATTAIDNNTVNISGRYICEAIINDIRN